MEKTPLVSIIIPCYNGAKFIDVLFNSILTQTYDNLEVIFVNDGSTDTTESLVLGYKDAFEKKFGKEAFHYVFQENQGVGYATKNGLSFVKGEYFIVFDSDDIFEKNYFEEAVKYFQNNPEVKLLTTDVYLLENGKNTGVAYGNYGEDLFEKYLLYKFKYSTYIKFIFETKAFDSVTSRDIFPSRNGQNAQMVLPMLYHFKSGEGYINKPLYTALIHDESHSRNVRSYDDIKARSIGYEEIYVKTIEKMDIPEKQKYLDMISENYLHPRLRLALDNYDFEYARINYKKLKKKKWLTKEEKKRYRQRLKRIEFWCSTKLYKLLKK